MATDATVPTLTAIRHPNTPTLVAELTQGELVELKDHTWVVAHVGQGAIVLMPVLVIEGAEACSPIDGVLTN